MRAPWKLLAAALLVSTLPVVSEAATFQLVVNDPAGQGFNDTTYAAPVPGNTGTTLGQQRRNSFQAAANAWGAKLQSNVTIRVGVQMSALTCTSTSGTLGHAGPDEVFRGFTGAPRASTWYVKALADSLAGSDQDPSSADIDATFNSTLDAGSSGCLGGMTWWYGIGSPAVGNAVDFYSTVLHELGHGLGFLTFVNIQTGAKFNGYDDAFMVNLKDSYYGMTWPNLSDTWRMNSATNTGGLLWNGTNVTSRASGLFSAGVNSSGQPRMYAPGVIQTGSSVSHWDTVLTPNELMEPVANSNMKDIITTYALEDMGWQLLGGGGGACVQDAYTACLIGGRYKVTSHWQDQYDRTQDGPLSATKLTDTTAAFWHFDASKFEYFIRINTATDNGKAWIAIPSFTNVEFWVEVTDTTSGQYKEYHLPQSTDLPRLIYDPSYFVYP